MCKPVSILFALVALSLVSCEGPAGPVGPVGPQGEPGPPREGTIIEWKLSNSSYDREGNILIEDERITPTSFQALYLKANFGTNRVAYIPIEYLIVFAVSLAPEEDEWETPVLALTEGALLILDPNQDLLATAREFLLEGLDVDLAILVSQ